MFVGSILKIISYFCRIFLMSVKRKLTRRSFYEEIVIVRLCNYGNDVLC